jgi:hypothetical protein
MQTKERPLQFAGSFAQRLQEERGVTSGLAHVPHSAIVRQPPRREMGVAEIAI